MKRLTTNGTNTEFFFEESVTIEQLKDWVYENMDKFELNEAYSCNVKEYGGMLHIYGDEDSVDVEIESVELIKL